MNIKSSVIESPELLTLKDENDVECRGLVCVFDGKPPTNTGFISAELSELFLKILSMFSFPFFGDFKIIPQCFQRSCADFFPHL